MTKEPPYQKHTHMLIKMGRFEQALMVAEKWVEAKPQETDAWFCKSACELTLGRAPLALRSVAKALQFDPDDSRFLAHRARCLATAGDFRESLEIARVLVKREHDNPQLLDALATTLSTAGESEEALAVIERAIEINAGIAQYHTNHGTLLQFSGRADDAEAAHKRALELKPDDFHGYWLLSRLRRASADRNFVEWFSRALEGNQEKLIARVCLNYALGKQHEDLGNYDESFHHYEAGAAAALEHTPYHEAKANALLDLYREEFSKERFELQTTGCDNDEAIFIVGMPRSGTTLVERIVASYDEVYAAGELHNFTHLFNRRCAALNPGKKNLDLLAGSAALDFVELGEAYLESTRPRTGHTRHFIDKYPFNFQLLGPIALALPKAKFIHLERNPMDTCFSNFKLLFQLGSAAYSYDQETLAGFYAQYRKMMAHWHECLPGRILDVNYEQLVQDPEGGARRITDFLGFDWRPECLEFYKSKEAVTTASTSQIREPINTASLNKWRKYEQHLQPLQAALEKHGIDT